MHNFSEILDPFYKKTEIMRIKSITPYCFILLTISILSCNKTDKTATQKKYHDTFAGIGFVTLKDEALAKKKTQFEFFEDKATTQAFGSFDFKTGKSASEKIVPEFFRPEDDVCYFRCIGWDRNRYYVYSNTLLESLKYIPVDTNKYRFVKWEDLMTHIPEITRLNPETNPVKTRPNFKASNAEWDDASRHTFVVKEIEKKWAKVSNPAGNQEGWIVWVDKDRIQVKFDKNHVKPLSKLQGSSDPSANPLNFLRPKMVQEKKE